MNRLSMRQLSGYLTAESEKRGGRPKLKGVPATPSSIRAAARKAGWKGK